MNDTNRPNDRLIGGPHPVMPAEAGIHDFLRAPSKVADAVMRRRDMGAARCVNPFDTRYHLRKLAALVPQ
jgi:hypothetical protein